MNKRFCDYFWRGVIALGVVFALYIMGYLAIVRREETTSVVAQTTPEGELSSKVVSACWRWGRGGCWVGYVLFRPAHRLDARYFRRHYWSAYSVIVAPGRTNMIYDCDRKQ